MLLTALLTLKPKIVEILNSPLSQLISKLKNDIMRVESEGGFWLRLCEQNLRFNRIQSSEFNSEHLVDEITAWLKSKWDTSYTSSTW